MEMPECPGCRERDARIDVLERELQELKGAVRDLQARFKTNSTNSSLPPSANPLGADKPVVKKKSKRKPGAQPGHEPHLKQLLPFDRVKEVHAFVPECCRKCQATLPAQTRPGDPEPKRFQMVEIPALVAYAVEYQGHGRRCACCGEITWASIPAEHMAHGVGPRLAAVLSYWTGCHGMSKRGVEEAAEAIFDVSISLGTVANLEREISVALESAHREALDAVRTAPVKHADETSWKLRGDLCWLWAAATSRVAAFVIHAKRGAVGLVALLGEEIQGVLCSDRWGVYHQVPAERRQLCWAHLKRDFQKIIDRGGPGEKVGRDGQRLIKRVFAAWHEFRDGKCTRKELEQKMDPVVRSVNRVLIEGASGDDAQVATFCENILELEPALWTFIDRPGVEPTNNHMERLLRRAVLWRKRSFGSWSETGCRFVERILTVVQTRRLQGKNVLDYLHDALLASRTKTACPKLV